MSHLTEKQLKKDAKQRVDFKKHLLIYALVIALLWVIWAVKGAGYMWARLAGRRLGYRDSCPLYPCFL